MKRGFVLLLASCFSINGGGQSLFLKDSLVAGSLGNPSDSSGSAVILRLSQNLDYSLFLTGLLRMNSHHGTTPGVVSAFHHLKYELHITSRGSVRVSNTFNHDLGLQYFIDSLFRFQPDENTLDTRMEIKTGKNLSVTLLSILTTRMFNSYRQQNNLAGKPVNVLNAAFLTPMLWTFSAGFGWTLLRSGNISLGIPAAKLTWIRNRKVYFQQDILEFYGVPKEKKQVFEYGLSAHLLVDRDFLTRIHWNCDVLVFKNYRKPIDLVLKNFFVIRINKYLKASIQTRLYYEREVSRQIRMENLVSFGCYFNL